MPEVIEKVTCFHCGDPCEDTIYSNDLPFCCDGCKTVYEILNTNNLCGYYDLNDRSAISLKDKSISFYNFLDTPDIQRKILTFASPDLSKVNFKIPSIHCVSCIWLLENLRSLNAGVIKAEVNFGKKNVSIDFNPAEVKLSELASLLAKVGYAPDISMDDGDVKDQTISDHSLVYKLTVAGFCFGNIMLFSFPEYLGLDGNDHLLRSVFSWLNVALSIPVLVYSSTSYFTSAAKSFKQKQINIDVPIAIGLLALFLRSLYDIATLSGPGYLDSFSGLVFFLLIGRWFQDRTYQSLSFDRDFKSYFPLAVNRLSDNEWIPTIIHELKKDDRIKIRNMEIVPADATLSGAEAVFDYSFVTGEAKPIKVKQGSLVYAGGRLIGKPVELILEKITSQSHLTSLWNNEVFKKTNESHYQKMLDQVARVFTWVVLGIALATAVVWSFYSPQQMWLVLTAVLMVACPCALALASPFTYGNMLRVFGKHGFYLKNADVIERLAAIDAVVFDKTGTVTHGSKPEIEFLGDMDDMERAAVRQLTSSSTHPLSVIVSDFIKKETQYPVLDFKEIPGYGVQGSINGKFIQAGSSNFVGFKGELNSDRSYVFIAVDHEVKGYFQVKIRIRPNIKQMVSRLGKKCVALVSGDNDGDKQSMQSVFQPHTNLLFNQNPHDKLSFILGLQKENKKVLMIGDGLNDAGALKQSNVGVAVTDNTGIFSPACDGILEGVRLNQLDRFLALAKSSASILKAAFAISFFYNVVALTFAVTGHLTPLLAAVLMPVSSISVVGFSTLAVNYMAKRELQRTE